MSKRTGNRKGKRGRGKYNKQFAHERGAVLAKRMRKRQKAEALAKLNEELEKKASKPPPDPTEGFF